MEGLIFNIQKFSVHDGPGIRTLIFFKGCPLSCLWCSNPEGISLKPTLMFNESECHFCQKCQESCSQNGHVIINGKHKIERENCIHCNKCIQNCKFDAIHFSGKKMSLDEVYNIALQDEVFYQSSGGGITLGGGDPLMQPEFAVQLLKKLKDRKIHTSVETSAFTSWKNLDLVTSYTDHLFIDIKHMDNEIHKQITSQENKQILENVKKVLEKGTPLVIRVPIIPGMTDSKTSIQDLLSFLKENKKGSLLGVEFMPYHKFGKGKYERLGLEYQVNTNEEHLEEFILSSKKLFLENNIITL